MEDNNNNNYDKYDKIDLENVKILKERDSCFRLVINNKIFDTSHEDDLFKLIINHEDWMNLLVIRYEYYLSKIYHGLGKGDIVFYDQIKNLIYCVELKSLKDKYSNTSSSSKITKCIEQSIKYSELASEWCGIPGIPVTVIELEDGSIKIEVKHTTVIKKIEDVNPVIKEHDKNDKNDWFDHPGDQTETKYKILDNTFYSHRITDEIIISSGSRRSFRKRAQRVMSEVPNASKCNIYIITFLDSDRNVIHTELNKL